MTAFIIILTACTFIGQAAIFGPLRALRYTAGIAVTLIGLWLVFVLAAAL